MKYTERLFPDLSQSVAPGRTPSENTKKKLPFKAPSRVETGKSASTASRPAAKAAAKPAAKKAAVTKASAASKSQSNGFKPASKAGAVVLSSDEDEDELDDTPPKKKQRRIAVSDDDEEEDEVGELSDKSEEEQPARKQAAKPKAGNEELAIPQKLLTRLLYEGFEDKNMKIGKEAMTVVGKYIETFAREALARAVFEREEAEAEIGRDTGDGFLQVEDLEKLAPQLLLDF